MHEPIEPVIYQFKVVLRRVSPMIWRRLLVRSDSTIADLHYTLQIGMGWTDSHLHRFRIYGNDFGVYQIGGPIFDDVAAKVHLADFHFRLGERFLYEYDFGNRWQHDIRLEQILPIEPEKIYPACIGGKRSAPPEDCGGAWKFIQLRQHYSPASGWRLLAELKDAVRAGDTDAVDLQIEQIQELLPWLELDRFDSACRQSPTEAVCHWRRGMDVGIRWEGSMNIKIQVVIETEDNNEVVQEVLQLKRGALRVEEFGLTLAEAKAMLQGVQQSMVEQQSAEYLQQQSSCALCGTQRLHKGTHQIVYRTLFGKLHLNSPRLHHCSCQAHATKTFSPLAELLKERTSPELLYVESKYAALMSYGLTADVLEDLLPIGRVVHPATVRNHVHAVAERMEAELGEEKVFFIEGCERDRKQLPQPLLPLTVELDGGFVHSSEQTARTDGWFEVITGKSMTATGTAKCFAFVNTFDQKPKRRLFELLKSQGMAMNQQVTFLSDGGADVREVQFHFNPEAEHWLDWFHITMRITVMTNMAKGLKWQQELLEEGDHKEPELSAKAIKELERVKWFLWHGNVVRALESVEEFEDLVAVSEPTENSPKLEKAAEEFHTYIQINADLIPNFGERRRNGERISTATAESTVNQVISKRMVKKQQMRWSRRGAHLLLQLRTRELNGELRRTFADWYPAMDREAEPRKQAA